MIERIFRRLIPLKERKSFSTWQIELTTRCPLQCKMCIRAESKTWQPQDMVIEDFKKILPDLREVENVVLEGWGESLLHGNLVECVSLAKKEGPQVGFVTSGKGLGERRVSELMEAGVDFLGFSIAGTTSQVHDSIRVNSHLPEILNGIRLISEQRLRYGTTLPRLHLICLMLQENISEVPEVPGLAKKMGIGEVILTNICHSINRWQEEQRVFTWGKGQSEYERFVKKAEANARKLKVRLKRPSLSASEVAVCEEDPLRNLYISASGEVSPCVYLYPPLGSPFKRIFCGKEFWVERVSFGNIFREPFFTIWDGIEYVRFREAFLQRRKRMGALSLSLCDGSMIQSLKENRLPDAPEPCKTCHKLLGV